MQNCKQVTEPKVHKQIEYDIFITFNTLFKYSNCSFMPSNLSLHDIVSVCFPFMANF